MSNEHAAFVAQMLTLANPEDMKKGFAIMIDGVIEQSENIIIDWGTAVIRSTRVLDPDNGEEMIHFLMSVHILDGGEDVDGDY